MAVAFGAKLPFMFWSENTMGFFALLFFIHSATLIWWLWASVGGVLYANVIGTIGFVQSSQLLCGVAWPCLGFVLFVGGVLYFIGSGVALAFASGVLGASSVYSSLLLLNCYSNI